MLTTFRAFVSAHIQPSHQPLLLAVSGGRDSVAMAHLMSLTGYPFAMAHCNFNLRPGDCDRDESFVRRLADSYQVSVHVASFDTHAYAATHKLSIETAARDLRYEFFAELVAEHHYCGVATGHHLDDSIETFFLNLLRGTGIDGLRGIRPVSDRQIAVGYTILSLPIYRPLLQFSRHQIDQYVTSHQLQFVEDYTNASLEYRRNRIRHQLLPLLREINPSADDSIASTISNLAEVAEVYHAHVQAFSERHLQHREGYIFLSFDSIQGLQSQHALLFELLRPFGFNDFQVRDILSDLSRQPGSTFLSSTHRLLFSKEGLSIYPQSAQEVASPQLQREVLAPSEVLSLKVPSYQLLLDADRVEEPLSMRHPRAGDRFQPFGLHGASQLLSDYFKDHHVDSVSRQTQWLLVDAHDRILWIVGLRSGNLCAVTPSTQHILRLSVPQE